ncbi:MAG: SET domain-containing protein-lysine N-methyltransferase [Sedimenticola sp.]|nr:SET domain-containing protein-lysine N-methyltransferase [Sedimenticola sp.]
MTITRRIRNSELSTLVYTAPSTVHGTGVFAKRELSEGEYIGTYHGPEAKRNGTYVLWVFESDDEASAVGRSGKNLLRFLNHSTPGNAEFDGFDLYALTDIAIGEEITFDYQSEV